jgi:hypothetical protein
MTRILLAGSCRCVRRTAIASALFLTALHSVTATGAAQVIALKTLPIAEGDQFSFFPSANFGMAGVSIAIPDSVHDPFVNPAKGGRIGRAYFFGAPTFFSVSQRAGSGSTFPAGIVARSGTAFGGAAVAIQSITDGRRVSSPPPPNAFATGAGDFSADHSHSNRYAFALLGRTFPVQKLSIGASALWSGLGAIDGVNLLYADSWSVNQSGGSADIRFGMLKEWNRGRSLEALLLHNRIGMTHDVTYTDLYWDPIQRQPISRPRLEQDRDRTRTWGIHLAYQHPLADSGWRVGALFTANRINQPNTPEYEVASIPGNRGRSSAFNIGIGLARLQGGTTIAVDAIYEPIRSRLWAQADSAVATESGPAIEAGGITLDNRLHFSNALLRAGVSHDLALDKSGSALRLEFGVQARSIYYTLDQHDRVGDATRTGNENWMEWTRSWGGIVRLPAIELHYRGRLTSGAGRPGVGESGVVFPQVDLAPTKPLPSGSFGPTTMTMKDVRVVTHQLSISLPIR